MRIRLKPKTFGPIRVHVDADGGLSEAPGAEGRSALESPVDAVLYGLGACIGKSIQLAAGSGVAVGPIDVVVAAVKAEDLPSRVARFDVRVAPGFTDDDAVAADLLAKAKKICTVSNTLNAAVTLALAD